MNIFILEETPQLAAQYHCDKHVVKMILEYSQLLSTAHRVLDGDSAPDILYKATHINHPCTRWTRETTDNYLWLYNLLHSLHSEYRHRYGKEHKSVALMNALFNFPNNIESGERTPFALAMPDEYKCEDAVQAYRDYYIGEKAHFCTWKNRDVPFWFHYKEQVA